MEFFAFIGLITVFLIIYYGVKNWAEKSLEEIEEKKRDKQDDDETEDLLGGEQITMEEIFNNLAHSEEKGDGRMVNKLASYLKQNKLFVLDTSDESLYVPMFKPLPATNNQSAISFNLELKEIGSYARLYFHLKNVYGEKAIPTFAQADNRVRIAIYETQMLREEIYKQYFIGRQCNRQTNPFTMEESWQIGYAAANLRAFSIPLIYYYDLAREECFKLEQFEDDGYCDFDPTNLPKTAKLVKLEAIHEAEKEHFRGSKQTKEIYEDSIKKQISEVFTPQ